MTETDFAAVIADLRAVGLNPAEIAEATGSGRTTIDDLANGKSRQPRFVTGVRLLQLHAERVRPAAGNEEAELEQAA